MNYSKKLQDERWIALSIRILRRDKYTCIECGKEHAAHRLHVHHKRYITGREPWDYDPSVLITLCADCHADIHNINVKGATCHICSAKVTNAQGYGRDDKHTFFCEKCVAKMEKRRNCNEGDYDVR